MKQFFSVFPELYLYLFACRIKYLQKYLQDNSLSFFQLSIRDPLIVYCFMLGLNSLVFCFKIMKEILNFTVLI